ncbi:MAG: hypothetical protein HRT87_11065 [Legionellales bacterium]|nr:hypothetical protein [Legionellales bacterium]
MTNLNYKTPSFSSTDKSTPRHITQWLQYTKCITKYCKATNLDYQLKLICQSIDQEEQIFIRKTISHIENTPAIFAITTLNYQAYLEFKDILDNLETKPIGENLLYSSHSSRSPFTYTTIYPYYEEYNCIPEQYRSLFKILFKRTSIFTINNHQIELKEYFLPTITEKAPDVN